MSLTLKGPWVSRCVAAIHDGWATTSGEASTSLGRCVRAGKGAWPGQVGMVEV